MSANQPSQQTASTKFLKHTLLSFAMGILFAVLTAIGNYVYTAGNAIDIKVVASVAGAAFLAYLLSHFISDIKPNWPQIEQGLSDMIDQSVQNAHAPLYNAVGQLQQQVAQIPAQVAQVAQTAQIAPPPPSQPVANTTIIPQFDMTQPSGTWASPISQMPTNVEMPAVITSQPWQPPARGVFEDTGPMPVVTQP